MAHQLTAYLEMLDLPAEAAQRLHGRAVDIHIDDDADPAMAELYALRRSIELLTKPVVQKIRINEFLDDIRIVDTVHQRTYREIAGDEMPVHNEPVEIALLNLMAIEETTRRMGELLDHGTKSAEKLRIKSALPVAFTKDNDMYLLQLKQGFAAWATELDNYVEQYGKHFDDEQAQCMQAASTIAHHAAKRCTDIEIGPKIGIAR